MWDFLITDPLVRRVRKMRNIEKELIKLTAIRRNGLAKAEALTKEYEELKLQCKNLKKTGSP